MKYFFQIGSNPTLSIAEIVAIFSKFKKNIEIISNDILILETEEIFDTQDKIKKMGGVIKIGEIVEETKKVHSSNIVEILVKMIKETEGKFKYGISYYGEDKFNVKVVGMEIKKYLQEKNISCRYVVSKEKTLSSVVVEQNKLTSKGIEFVLIKNGYKLIIGKTLAVQAFKALSKRDYGRPARDDKSGMLPPKLAQIMLNLASQGEVVDKILLDPFCGSGTVLNEAMLMGCKKMIGSDLSEKAVNDTKENLVWLYKNNNVKMPDCKFYKISADKLSNKIKKDSVDIIVTEPFLGPQRGQIDFKKTVKELEELYSKAIVEFDKVLTRNGRIVMIWPVFLNKININPKLNGFKIVSPLYNVDDIKDNKNIINISKANTIIYGRLGQRVWREIVILSKK